VRVPTDLDPADLAAREGLRAALIGIREEIGWSQRQLSIALGSNITLAHQMENTVNWKVSTVQRWAHTLKHRFTFEPSEELPYTDILFIRPTDPSEAMTWDRRALIDALTEAREYLGIGRHELAGRLAVTDNAVKTVERNDDVLVVTAQRFCRALGGSLRIGIAGVRSWWS